MHQRAAAQHRQRRSRGRPTRKQIAYVSARPGPETADATGDPIVITRYLYKPTASEGNSHFNDNKRLHIFVVDVASGESRQLTNGTHYEHSIDWSPDGKRNRLRFQPRAQRGSVLQLRSLHSRRRHRRNASASPPPRTPSTARAGRPTARPSPTKPPSAASPISKPPWKTRTSG